MALQIRYECPKCNQTLPLDISDLAPGRKQICHACQTQARMTKTCLEHFSKDLHLYLNT